MDVGECAYVDLDLEDGAMIAVMLISMCANDKRWATYLTVGHWVLSIYRNPV